MDDPKTLTRATLSSEEFNTLVRLAQAVEIEQLRSRAVIGQALLKRDAYYATLAAAYHLAPTWSALTWNDETCEIELVPIAKNGAAGTP